MNILYKSDYIALKQNTDVQTYLAPGRLSEVEWDQIQAWQAVDGKRQVHDRRPLLRPFWNLGVPQATRTLMQNTHHRTIDPDHVSTGECETEEDV